MPKKKVKAKHHTPAERILMRRHKRKHGPSGVRRAERRSGLQPSRVFPCGCKVTPVRMITCQDHTIDGIHEMIAIEAEAAKEKEIA